MLGKLKKLFRRRPHGEATLSAVIIRADGTREDLGVISRTKIEDWGVKNG